jgi:nitroreductase
VILDCLRIAVQAPTASNSQIWHWMVVTDPDKKALVASSYRKMGQGYLEQAAATEKDDQTQRVYESALRLAQTLEQVPVLVIPCVAGKLDGLPNSIAAGVYGSIIQATWSFQLALRSRGLGSVFTTLHLFDAEAVAAALEIPDGYTQVGLLPVAYTIGDDFKPAKRPPVETITYWDTWGRTEPGNPG